MCQPLQPPSTRRAKSWTMLFELFEFLIGRGATTICIAGDNGESWALNATERGHLVRLAKDIAKDRVRVMMGIS